MCALFPSFVFRLQSASCCKCSCRCYQWSLISWCKWREDLFEFIPDIWQKCFALDLHSIVPVERPIDYKSCILYSTILQTMLLCFIKLNVVFLPFWLHWFPFIPVWCLMICTLCNPPSYTSILRYFLSNLEPDWYICTVDIMIKSLYTYLVSVYVFIFVFYTQCISWSQFFNIHNIKHWVPLSKRLH